MAAAVGGFERLDNDDNKNSGISITSITDMNKSPTGILINDKNKSTAVCLPSSMMDSKERMAKNVVFLYDTNLATIALTGLTKMIVDKTGNGSMSKWQNFLVDNRRDPLCPRTLDGSQESGERACEGVLEDGSKGRENAEKELSSTSLSSFSVGGVVADRMSCSTCSVVFDSRAEQVEHYKSDWHRLNIRRKLRGQIPVKESTFEEMTDDVSSISGSDSDASDSSASDADTSDINNDRSRANRRQNKATDRWGEGEKEKEEEDVGRCKVFLQKGSLGSDKFMFINGAGELISLHRSAIYCKKNEPESESELIALVQALPTNMNWAILLAGGGHFAGAIFNKDVVVVHKTFHRYVVRAKAGTAQSSRDNQGGHAPKSGGASLRRYNEAALAQEIQALITSWSADLKKCSRIFLRAPSFNRAIFLGGKTPVLDKNDPRIFPMSIRTRRPTLNEVKRLHKLLATIECLGRFDSVEDYYTSTIIDNDDGRLISTIKQAQSSITITCGAMESNGSESSGVSEGMGKTLARTDIGSFPDALSEYEQMKKSNKKKNKTARSVIAVTANLQESGGPTDDCLSAQENMDYLKSVDDLYAHQDTLDALYTVTKTGDIATLTRYLTQFSSHNSLVNQAPSSLVESLDNSILRNHESIDNVRTECVSGGNTDESGTLSVGISGKVSCGSYSQEIGRVAGDEVRTGGVSDLVLTDVICRSFGRPSTTLLHVAARAGHRSVVRVLLEHGADPTIKDGLGQFAYVVSSNKETKNEFRRFQATYPDKFDYTRAQIPGPLTDELEAERRAKMAEKKKIQMKAKKERLKEERVEEEKRLAEERSKQAFLVLSDREKRAYAAEQRLKLQQSNVTQSSSSLASSFHSLS